MTVTPNARPAARRRSPLQPTSRQRDDGHRTACIPARQRRQRQPNVEAAQSVPGTTTRLPCSTTIRSGVRLDRSRSPSVPQPWGPATGRSRWSVGGGLSGNTTLTSPQAGATAARRRSSTSRRRWWQPRPLLRRYRSGNTNPPTVTVPRLDAVASPATANLHGEVTNNDQRCRARPSCSCSRRR